MDLASQFDCFLLDLDGTLFRGESVVPGATEAVARLRAAEAGVVFMTNNSSRTPAEVTASLVDLGFAADEQEVVTSAMVTAGLLAARGATEAYVIGETGIRQALSSEGIKVLEGAPSESEYVVVGFDRAADYASLRTACLLVQRGARLVATNADAAFPAPEGWWPGAGALLSVITTTTGTVPEVVGKPHAPIFEAAHAAGGGGRPLVVGDRLDTDVEGANRLGWSSLLVLSGISDRAALAAASVRPTWVAEDLSGLFEEGASP
jgi:glycerol 3-phosphatase-2